MWEAFWKRRQQKVQCNDVKEEEQQQHYGGDDEKKIGGRAGEGKFPTFGLKPLQKFWWLHAKPKRRKKWGK